MHSSADLLKKANLLDSAGLHSKADILTLKIIRTSQEEFGAQEQTSPVIPPEYISYRNVAYYLKQTHNIDLLATPKHLSVLIKALKTGTEIPGYQQGINLATILFKDPKALQGVDNFLKNYPQVLSEINEMNQVAKMAGRKNFLTLINSEVTKLPDLRNPKAISDRLKSITNVFKEKQSKINVTKEINKLLQKNKLGYINTVEGVDAAVLKAASGISKADELMRAEQVFNRGFEALKKLTPGTQEYKKLYSALENYDRYIRGYKEGGKVVPGLRQVVEEGKGAVKTLQKAGQLAQVTDDATKIAQKVAQEVPLFSKFAGALGILFSLPAAYKWIEKYKNGEEFWNDPNERADFIVDLLNFGSSTLMIIPGGQVLSAILGGGALAIQGGKYLAEKINEPNAEDLKITGNLDESKLNQMDQYKLESEDYWVNNLISEITPGAFTDFNNETDPSGHRQGIKALNFKISEINKKITEWINKDPQKQKWYSWFLNPTEENKSMLHKFNTKLVALVNTMKKGGEPGQELTYNSFEDVKRIIDETFRNNPLIANSFRQTISLRDIVYKLRKEQGLRDWFTKIPWSLADKELLAWFNQNPEPSSWN